ncbi:MAG: ACP phosphodiesterase [Bacteroidota bacterium]
MNHLAHVFLSFRDPDLLAGNLMTDFMKGKPAIDHLPEGIQKGIYLHRQIDQFTDQHAVVKQSKQRLYAHFGKYASVVVDIYFDHLLAINWANYEKEQLQDFVNASYDMLLENIQWMPPVLKRRLPEMIGHNWLARYANLHDMDRTFYYLSKRAKFENQLDKGAEVLAAHLDAFNEEFLAFFPELIQHSQESLETFSNPK